MFKRCRYYVLRIYSRITKVWLTLSKKYVFGENTCLTMRNTKKTHDFYTNKNANAKNRRANALEHSTSQVMGTGLDALSATQTQNEG